MFRPAKMLLVNIIYPLRYEDAVVYSLMTSKSFHPEKPKITITPEGVADVRDRLSKASEAYDKLNSIVENFNLTAIPLFGRVALELKRRELEGNSWSELLEHISKKALEYDNTIQEYISRIKSLEEKIEYLKALRESLRTVEKYDLSLEKVNKKGEVFATLFGIIPEANLREAMVAFNAIKALVYSLPIGEGELIIYVAVRSQYFPELERIVQAYGISKVQVPEEYPSRISEAIKSIEGDIRVLEYEKSRLEKELKRFLDENRSDIIALRDAALITRTYYETLTYTHRVEHFAQISGYVPERKLASLRREVEKSSNGTAVLIAEEVEEAPTHIDYPQFLEPIVEVLKLYGLPGYKEVSPLILMAITFPIIYGLMYADLGHGLTLTILGILAYKYLNSPSFKTLGLLGVYFGVASTVAGFFSGEVFGPITPLSYWLKGLLKNLGFPHPPLGIEFEESGSEGIIMDLLLFSIKIGIVHMLSGFILGIVNLWNEGEKVEALTVALPQTVIFVLGTAPFLFAYKAGGGTVLPLLTEGGQINPNPTWMYSLVLFILVLALARPIVDRVRRVKEPTGFGFSFFEAFDYILRLISNTASYMRITALLVAHVGLVYAFYKLGELIAGIGGPAGPILFWATYVLGNILTIALEAIIVFVQAARLHFYEWFSKFYRGSGVEFRPLGSSTAYVEVKVSLMR